jgi:hypothetical protein
MTKQSTLFLALILLISSCKSDKKTEEPTAEEQTILEKVANAHGISNWNSIEELKFTFNVDRDTMHFERHWVWNTKTQDVLGISRGDTINYNRKSVDSIAMRADGAFINDKFWLLAPINIFWDQNNLTYSQEDMAIAPISNDTLQKLTVVYGNEGGYTPGDAYDFYLADDYLIKEWVFRKGNSGEPTSTATWEDYQTTGGLILSMTHANKEHNFKLYFTGVEAVTKKD